MSADESFMKLAIEEARSGMAAGDGGPFGAAIVGRNGKLIAKAHNTVLKDNNPTHHAEINAISIASKKLGTYDLSGCTLYATCRPCMMCSGAIIWARIKRISYGAGGADAKKLGFSEPAAPDSEFRKNRVSLKGGLLKGECISLMRAWAGSQNKRVY